MAMPYQLDHFCFSLCTLSSAEEIVATTSLILVVRQHGVRDTDDALQSGKGSMNDAHPLEKSRHVEFAAQVSREAI